MKSVHIKSSESPRGSKFQTSATRFESYFSSLFVLRTLRYSCKEQTRCRTETFPLRPLVPRLSDESLEKIRQDLPRPEYGHKSLLGFHLKAAAISPQFKQHLSSPAGKNCPRSTTPLAARLTFAHLLAASQLLATPARHGPIVGSFFFELMRGVCPQLLRLCPSAGPTNWRYLQQHWVRSPPCGPLLLCAEIPQTQSEAT
jgi:hypothetical protein